MRVSSFSPSATAIALQEQMRGRALSEFDRRVIAVLRSDLFARREGLTTSEACKLSYERLRYLNRALGLTIPELFSDIDRLLALHQWTSVVDGTLTTLLTIHFNLCIGSILEFGQGQPELLGVLKELEAMDSIGVFLATELAYGNNVQALETRADYDHEAQEFVIHTPNPRAQKFMPNTGAAGIPKVAVVMARLFVRNEDCGVFPFVVRIRTASGTCPGVHVQSLGEKPDYALDNAITWFDQVRVPRGHWLSGGDSEIDATGSFRSEISSRRERFLRSMDRVQTGKLCLGVAASATMAAAAQLALKYSKQRRTFGPGSHDVPVLSYRTQQKAIFEALAATYAGSALLRETAEACRLRDPETETEYRRLLAMAKVFVSSRAIDNITRCRERVGAQGLFSANRIMTYFIHVNGIVTAEGDNEVLLMKTAREMLLEDGYAPPAEEPSDREPGTTPRSRASLVRLARAYERKLQQKLRAEIAQGMMTRSRFDAWNDSLGAATRLASVHAVRLALEAFDRAVEAVSDEQARRVLECLFRSFALKELSGQALGLVVEGLADAALLAEIERERDRAVVLLNDDLGLLEAALYVPADLLDAPIGEDYEAAYDCMSERPAPKSTDIRDLFGAARRRVS
jgi:acyl-CoA oxidase